MWATFRVGEALLAVEATAVREFLRRLETTPLPLGPRALEGLANLRGVVIPVLALDRWLGIGSGANGEAEPVVVVETGAGPVGWRVDEVGGVRPAPEGPLDELPDAAPGELRAASIGIARLGDEIAILLDPEACSALKSGQAPIGDG